MFIFVTVIVSEKAVFVVNEHLQKSIMYELRPTFLALKIHAVESVLDSYPCAIPLFAIANDE